MYVCMRAGTLGYFNSIVAISPGRPCNEKSIILGDAEV